MDQPAKIKVIGVGGAGGIAVNNMIRSKLDGVEFISVNTDAQSLDISKAATKIQLGFNLTEGLGAGGKPDVGSEAARESASDIRAALKGCHTVFIAAGFGGATGTGAVPIIANICKDIGILTVAVVTRPFSFEGKKRIQLANQGLEILEKVTDTVITIPNDRLPLPAPKMPNWWIFFARPMKFCCIQLKVLRILSSNLDFADIKTIMGRFGHDGYRRIRRR